MQGYLDEKRLYKWEKSRRRGKKGYVFLYTFGVAIIYILVTLLVNRSISNISINEIVIFILFTVLVGNMNSMQWNRMETSYFETIKLAQYRKKFNKDGSLK